MANVTIRLLALDGTWETCGADRAIGVVPESVQLTSDAWGPLTASFELRRTPGAIWPDLGSFAPVVVEIGGVAVWKGTTNETPIRDGTDPVVSVQCKGRQAHLDDDVYKRIYVHTKLDQWKDARSFVDCNLAQYVTAPSISSDRGITVQAPKDMVLASGQRALAGAILDLGPGNTASRVVLDWEHSNNDATSYMVLRGADSVAELIDGGSHEQLVGTTLTGGSTGVGAGTFRVPHRYLMFGWYRGTSGTLGADVWVRAKAISAFSDAAYESGNASALKASAVIADALDRATTLLSADRSQVQATSFNIPDYAPERYVTPRETLEAVNVYHNWITQIDLADRAVFRPRPTAPLFEVGAWSGAEFTDASANAGEEVYNRCILTGQNGDGSPVIVDRSAGQTNSTALVSGSDVPQIANRSFDVNTSGWVAGGPTPPTISRTTTGGEFDSAPAGGKITFGLSASGSATAAITGTFRRSTTYVLRFRAYMSGVVAVPGPSFGDHASGDTASLGASIANRGTFADYEIAWTPAADTSSAALVFTGFLSQVLWVDSVTIFASRPTVVDRRGFRRTKVLEAAFSVTPAGGTQLTDTFLAAHRTVPLKGSVKIAPGGCRTVLGGAPVHPSILLTRTQELLRLTHRVDPDTGAVGRVGTMAQVTYLHRDESSAVELDDPRRNFDALMNRLAVVQGAG